MSDNKKRKPRSNSFLRAGSEIEHARKKAAKAIAVEWRGFIEGGHSLADGFFDPATADEVDPFDMSDLIWSGSPEARGGQAGAKEGEISLAPCTHCTLDSCPGTVWMENCLLQRSSGSVRIGEIGFEDETEANMDEASDDLFSSEEGEDEMQLVEPEINRRSVTESASSTCRAKKAA